VKTELEILIAARARIADPERWCQFQLAQYPDGSAAHVMDPDARVCAIGAVYVVANGDYKIAERACELLGRSAGRPVMQVNALGHEHALGLFDTAIADLQSAKQ
jgi:hypothetical protein